MYYKLLESLVFILLDLGALIFLYFFLSIVRRQGKTSEKRTELMMQTKKLKERLDAMQSYPKD
jgi:preprotein translocase subunit YajC